MCKVVKVHTIGFTLLKNWVKCKLCDLWWLEAQVTYVCHLCGVFIVDDNPVHHTSKPINPKLWSPEVTFLNLILVCLVTSPILYFVFFKHHGPFWYWIKPTKFDHPLIYENVGKVWATFWFFGF